MPTKTHNFWTMPAYQQELAAIQRQQAIAEALLRDGDAGAPEEWRGMRVMPRFTFGQGLSQLGSKLAGSYITKQNSQRQRMLAERMMEGRSQAMSNLLAPTRTDASGTARQTSSPDDQSVVRPGAREIPKSHEERLADAALALDMGVPEEVVKSAIAASAPTEYINTRKQAGYSPQQIAEALQGKDARDAYTAPLTINGVAFDPYTGAPMLSAPDDTTGMQMIPSPNGDGTFLAHETPGFAQGRGNVAFAEQYGKDEASLQPGLVNARVRQAGMQRGAEQANSVFTGQTVTGPDGRVYQDVPVWGHQIPGVGPSPPAAGPATATAPPQQGPTFGSDKRKADIDAEVTRQRLESLTQQAQYAETLLGTMQQIKQFMDAGTLGSGPIDRLQRGAHEYGLTSDQAANTKQIEQLGAQLQLSRGSLGAGVSNYDAQTYSKAAGDFVNALNPVDRQNAYDRMVRSATNIMNKANAAIVQFRKSGQAPGYRNPNLPHVIYTPEEAAWFEMSPEERKRAYLGR